MKKTSKILIITIALIMIMQVLLPTISLAVDNIKKLNIRFERPYNNDDGKGEVGDDKYTIVVNDDEPQNVFKIGEQDENGQLNFNTAYYCLRGGLGFGSTETIVDEGVEYSWYADLNDSEKVIEYFNNTIGYKNGMPMENYNAIKWIAENMYLPKSEFAEELKAELLKNAGIPNSKLTDDDIEVVQQIALWYFTNYDNNGQGDYYSLDDEIDLGLTALCINGENYDRYGSTSFDEDRAQDINKLYAYLKTNAKQAQVKTEEHVKIEFDKENINSVIERKTDLFIVGPFKINGNKEYEFGYSLQYKEGSEQEWVNIESLSESIYLSDINGIPLEETIQIRDMIGGEEFYITLKGVSKLTDFKFDINYENSYYVTNASIWVADPEDQPVLKVEKAKETDNGSDSIELHREEEQFDLSLRKYIDYIERKGESVEFESRVPQVDTTPLTEGKETANYIHPKNTLTVKQGDIITYKLRVYNEGDLNGYATEITDYIPEGLGLLLGYTGNSNWLLESETKTPQALVGENGIYKNKEAVPVKGIFENQDLDNIQVVTRKEGALKIVDNTSLDDTLIRHYGATVQEGDLYQESINNENDGLFYQELEVTCIVLAPNTYEGVITNIAEISQDKAVDKFGAEVNIEDRDSNIANVMEDEKHTPGSEENGYIPGEQDDDDFEPVQLKYFDLALKKFITGVNKEIVDTRVPEFYIDENGECNYRHDKTLVEVTDKDDVTYTIRVFNEGSLSGYAEEIEDDIPKGLIFLPENEINKQYGWRMYYYDEEGVLTETEDAKKATVIRTTYLNSNLLNRFDRETMESPDYRDVKVVFKVSQFDIPVENDERIIVNKAHITKDSDDDVDSIPDKWNDDEDDQNKEYIYVQEFDLALYKWVTKTVVTVDGKTTETETGFKPNVGKTESEGDKYRLNSDPEPIASVTLDKKKLKSTEVKFVYSIKIVNEGDIAGYATEITDYIPNGLKFIPEDNPLWTLGEDGKITTRALETILLEPGKSATLPIVLTWINDENNLGQKVNIAAISEDYNEKDVDDVDSIPGNEDIPNYDIKIEKEQEDDDDFALVILQIKTGKEIAYIGLILVCITIISAGIITIKKYVL